MTKERKEVIIALIAADSALLADYQNFEQGEVVRAETPLFKGPLCYVDRPYEAPSAGWQARRQTVLPPGAILPRGRSRALQLLRSALAAILRAAEALSRTQHVWSTNRPAISAADCVGRRRRRAGDSAATRRLVASAT